MYEALYQDQNEYQAVGLKNAFIKQVFFNFVL